MFLKVEQGLSGLGQSVLMRQPGGRVIRVRMPIVLNRKRGMRGLGVTCPAGLVQTANGGCLDPTLGGVRRNIPTPTPTAVNYANAPGCNVVDLSKNECMLDDGTVTGCNIIQECDSLTGNARCQYGPFPGQAADPSLPFCSGAGPSVAYTPNPSLTNPTGPSTPFTPTKIFAANSGVVLPAGSPALPSLLLVLVDHRQVRRVRLRHRPHRRVPPRISRRTSCSNSWVGRLSSGRRGKRHHCGSAIGAVDSSRTARIFLACRFPTG